MKRLCHAHLILVLIVMVGMNSAFQLSTWNKSIRAKFCKLAMTEIAPEKLSLTKSVVEGSLDNAANEFSGISADIIAILSVYFVQGALGLSSLAVSFFSKDVLHFGPSEMAAVGGFTTLPWIIKPIYGFVSDGVPIFGYKRRSYLIIAGLLGFLSWVSLGTFVNDSTSAILAIVAGSASVAISDVVADSIVVEKSRTFSSTGSNAGGELQSLCWGTAAVGGIMSAYFSGSLLEYLSTKDVFLITSLFPLVVCLASFFIPEQKSNDEVNVATFKENVSAQLLLLKSAVFSPKIYLPVAFIFFWQATPSPDSALFFFTTNVLGFQPEFLGRVQLAASVASLTGVSLYRTLLKDVPTKSLIIWSTILSTALSLTQVLLVTRYNLVLGIPDQAFALTDTVVLTVLGQIAFMPTLVIAASLCPPGIEGTMFATLMSIYNAAGIVSRETGAGLTQLLGVTDKSYENLPLLVTLCSLSYLIPLAFVRLLDANSTKSLETFEKS